MTDIRTDLKRRDFTINSMAVDLSPGYFGGLIDPLGARQDLADKLIRALHPESFQDDSTRVWRAVRYAQRLKFQIEDSTLDWISSGMNYMQTISADRLRNELELCLEEDQPETIFSRADSMGILTCVSPAWRFLKFKERLFKKVRTLMQPYCPPRAIYLTVLFSDLELPDLEYINTRFNFSRLTRTVLMDSYNLRRNLSQLGSENLTPGQVYCLLKPFSIEAIISNRIELDPGLIQSRLDLYFNELRNIKTILNGDDLRVFGFSPGPQIGNILGKIKEARLEGRVTTRQDELDLLKTIRQTD